MRRDAVECIETAAPLMSGANRRSWPVALIVLVSGLVVASAARGAGFVKGPYLNKVLYTEAQVIVDLGADPAKPADVTEPLTVTVAFGENDVLDRDVQAIQKSDVMKGQFIAQLTDLRPDTVYAYQVETSRGMASKMYRFKTATTNVQPFSFLVFTDTQSLKQEHVRIVKATLDFIDAAPEAPAFLLHAGDVVNAPVQEMWNRYFANSRDLVARLSTWPAPGNHDNMDKQRLFREMFDLDDTSYRAFRHGGATFILLDTNMPRPARRKQWAWLFNTLESLPPREGPIVVVMHNPMYSAGHRKPGRRDLRRILGPSFETYGVDIVIAGHEHHYERTKRINGITYVIAGSAGTPVRAIEEGDAGNEFTAFISSPLNFLVFHVKGRMMSGQAIDADGNVFDRIPAFDWQANDPDGLSGGADSAGFKKGASAETVGR